MVSKREIYENVFILFGPHTRIPRMGKIKFQLVFSTKRKLEDRREKRETRSLT